MEALSFKTSEIEGPMDLILQLISKHKLNIYDIEISELVRQYLEHVRLMQVQNLEVGSEFLEMAARLVHIKTVELLPKHEKTEELRRELTGQLLEYQACKRAAVLLQEKSVMGDIFAKAPTPFSLDETYRLNHDKSLLFVAYTAAVGMSKRKLPPSSEVFTPIVSKRIVSVSSKIVFILKNLYGAGKVTLATLFGKAQERSELVATFLALLELMKDKRVQMDSGELITLGEVRVETEL